MSYMSYYLAVTIVPPFLHVGYPYFGDIFQTTLPECVLAAQFNALMHLQQALLLSSGADFLDMTGCRHPCVTEEVEIIYNTDIL